MACRRSVIREDRAVRSAQGITFSRHAAPRFESLPGAAALIRSLRNAGFAIAAGSSGPPENVFLVLELLGCRDLFDAVVTGTDVTKGKPDPEVFLTSGLDWDCGQRPVR